jgi:hypothetical protein
MSLRRCDNGHYYDENKHSSCPSCGLRDSAVEPTKPMRGIPPPDNADSPARPIDAQPSHRPEPKPAPELAATRPYRPSKSGVDPVVGWLVCIEGHEKGRDYRIRSERNLIGRATSMDICISSDETISREKHAVISFNPKKGSFLLAPGEGRGLVYLNDDEVSVPVELKPYDVIELGRTKLVFVPFCGERFHWHNEP